MHRSVSVLVASLAAMVAAGTAITPALAGLTADVAITKSHTGNFTAGQNGTFTITLHNNGPNATGSDTLTVTDVLPSGLTYVSSTGNAAGMPCSASSQTVTCSGAPNAGAGIANGGNLTFTITVAVAQGAPSTLQNTATFSDSFNADPNATNNSSTDTVTVNQPPSPSPSPTPSPSASATARPGLPASGGSPTSAPPVPGILVVLLVALAGGLARLAARRAR